MDESCHVILIKLIITNCGHCFCYIGILKLTTKDFMARQYGRVRVRVRMSIIEMNTLLIHSCNRHFLIRISKYCVSLLWPSSLF